MAPNSSSSMTLAAAVAAGGALATAPAFIGALQPKSSHTSPKALELSTAKTGDSFLASRSSAEPSKWEGLTVLSLAGVGVAAAAAMGSKAQARSRCSAAVPLARAQHGKVTLSAFDPSTEVGVTKPLGYWDPLGFSKDGDEETFKKFRASELKHGRVAMMATLGGVVEHFYRFPGFPAEGGGIALTDTTAGLYGWAAIFLGAAWFEVVAWVESPDKEPGNFGDPFGVDKYDEGMRTKELNNGRLAMFAAIGQVSAELYTGLDPMQQFGIGAFGRSSPAAGKAAAFTGSSLASSSRSNIVSRGAFDASAQVGVSKPLGFFDPLGYTKDIDESEFRKYRAAELKHGRVAMMASLGLVVQHYLSFPGLEKMPKGITAEFTQPGCYAFLALFAFAGVLELGAWSENADKEPGNFGDPAGWGNYSDEMRTKELNNGRFAMFCIIGQLSAELYTGQDVIGEVLP